MKRRHQRKNERGYVILTVMMILLLLLSAGAYALRSADHEQKASARFRKSEVVFHAADAGAAQRLAEVSLAADPQAAYDGSTSLTTTAWTTWPPAGFTTIGADQGLLQFRTGVIKMLWSGKTPPPGLPVGTPTYIFEFPAFATYADPSAQVDSGEATIRVGFKTWDTLPANYAP